VPLIAAGRAVENMADNLSPEEQQDRWLEEMKAVVKQQSFLMSAPAQPSSHFLAHLACSLPGPSPRLSHTAP